MKTVERTTDYETREVTETFIVCDKCGTENAPEESHPIDATGLEIVWCTDCFKAAFDAKPLASVSVGEEESSNAGVHPLFETPGLVVGAVAGVIRATIGAHNNFLRHTHLCLKDEHPDPIYGPVDGLFYIMMYLVFASLGVLAVTGIIYDVVVA